MAGRYSSLKSVYSSSVAARDGSSAIDRINALATWTQPSAVSVNRAGGAAARAGALRLYNVVGFLKTTFSSKPR